MRIHIHSMDENGEYFPYRSFYGNSYIVESCRKSCGRGMAGLPWEGNFHSHPIPIGFMWESPWGSICGSPQGKIIFLFSTQFHGYGDISMDPYGYPNLDHHTHGIGQRIGIWFSPVGIPIWISTGENHIPIPIPYPRQPCGMEMWIEILYLR